MLTYCFLVQELHKGGAIPWIMYYVHRVWRLSPVLVFSKSNCANTLVVVMETEHVVDETVAHKAKRKLYCYSSGFYLICFYIRIFPSSPSLSLFSSSFSSLSLTFFVFLLLSSSSFL